MASSLEMNKIIGAVLVGGMVALISGLLADQLVGTPHEEGAPGGGEAMVASAPAPAQPIEPVLPLLAAADPAAGQKIAQKCAQCHTFGKGEPAKVGPNLWGIVNNKHGHMPGFAYSKAIASIDKPWGYEELNHFIDNPRAYAPGTKMTFAGLPKVEDRAAVIAYLRTLADTPAPLPDQAAIDAAKKEYEEAKAKPAAAQPAAAKPAAAAQPAAGATQTAAAAAAAPIDERLAKADLAAGQKAAQKCAACHSFDKGGPNKIGPNQWDIVGGPHAHKADYSYSKAMAALHDKPWTYEAIDQFLAGPQAAVPGTKMTFAGIKKPEERADVILYLRSLSDNPKPLPH
jgi:cytochrome c